MRFATWTILVKLILLLASVVYGDDLLSEQHRAAVADAIAYTSDDQPAPGPSPGPTPPGPTPPGGDCRPCNGTGRIKPDGRIEVDCWYCGGDGVLSEKDKARIQAARSNPYEDQYRKLAESTAALLERVEKAQVATQVAAVTLTPKPPAKPVPPPDGLVDDEACIIAASWWVNGDLAAEASVRVDRPMLFHWYADWCGPCQAMERNVFPKVSGLLNNEVIAVKLDVDRLADPKSREKWKVEFIPTDQIVAPDLLGYITLQRTSDPDVYSRQVRDAAIIVMRNYHERRVSARRPKTVRRTIRYEPNYYYSEPTYYGGYGSYSGGGSCIGGGCGG